MLYSIKQVAVGSGISIRTLHHYDHIGLLHPERVSPSGYRQYSEANLERLQHILFFKELEFSLEEIQRLLDQPGFDRARALKAHRALLLKKHARLEAILATLEKTLKTHKGGKRMSMSELFNGFDMAEIEAHKRRYAQETKDTYGHTAAYRESKRKTAKYTEADWKRIMQDSREIYLRIARRMAHGPSDPEVQRGVGEWRAHITQHFYTCTLEMFKGLGELYISDPRFTQNINQVHPGLASFLSDAIAYYCKHTRD